MPSLPRRLACAETWANNKRAASLVELPGLTAWVHSVPLGSDLAGGDVHYVSVCPSCIVSRRVSTALRHSRTEFTDFYFVAAC